MSGDVLLAVSGLCKHFGAGRGILGRAAEPVRAVDDVSFEIRQGETLGLVGESGSGKSTTGYAILQLTPPTSGSIRFEGRELVGLSAGELPPDPPADADHLPGTRTRRSTRG